MGFLYLHGQNNYKTRGFVKNGFHKSKRTVHFGCKMLFWVGQNRLNSDNQLCMPEFMLSVYIIWDMYLTLRRAVKGRREKAFDYLLCDPEAKKDTRLKG